MSWYVCSPSSAQVWDRIAYREVRGSLIQRNCPVAVSSTRMMLERSGLGQYASALDSETYMWLGDCVPALGVLSRRDGGRLAGLAHPHSVERRLQEHSQNSVRDRIWLITSRRHGRTARDVFSAGEHLLTTEYWRVTRTVLLLATPLSRE